MKNITYFQNLMRAGQSFNISANSIKSSTADSIMKSIKPDTAIVRTPAQPDWNANIPSSTFAPGYRPEYSLFDRFLTDFQRSTPILDNSRFIRLNALQVEVQDLDFRNNLYPGRSATLGGTINKPVYKGSGEIPDGTDFRIDKKFLTAKELVTWTEIPEIFLMENLEGEQFENTLINLMSQSIAYEMERVFLYSNIATTYEHTEPEYKVYENDKGIFRQIREANRHLSTIDLTSSTDTPVEQFANFLLEYREPYPNAVTGGLPHIPKTDGTVTYTDDILMVKLREQLSLRETNLGDNIITSQVPNAAISLMGTTMYQSDSLSEPLAIANQQASTAPVLDNTLPKMLMTNASNLIYGVFNDLRLRSQYSIYDMAQVINFLVIGGALMMTPWKSAYADIKVS